ncbi:hypothetical protein V7S43_004048 [Phytophthora oleae]|uniref:Band 7 domain-containing protein n=1 Tax=Phytophthora oleae TaxID=2107226 RepID=A0ABD3FVD0_9STRA
MGDEAKGEDPGLVRRFVYELGPNVLEIQLRAAQDEAVRALARSVEHTDVYQLRDGTLCERFMTGALNARTIRPRPMDEFHAPVEETEEKEGEHQSENTLYYITEDIKRSLKKQFNTYGVQITSVAITNVTLPKEFQAQMENRTTHLGEIKEQKMKQLNDMQLLQYEEELATTKLKRDVMYMEEDQTAKAKCAEIRMGIDLIEAQRNLRMQKLRKRQV